MKVCIPGNNKGSGGPNSFKRNLIKELINLGIDVDTRFSSTGIDVVLLVGGTRNINWLRKLRSSNIPVIQRLGPMNWLHQYESILNSHKWRSVVRNSILFRIRENFANHVIYQSEFCKTWWTDVKGQDKCGNTVIYNGVDTSLFNPETLQLSSEALRLISVEGNLAYTQQVYRTPVELTTLLKQKDINVELTLVGDIDSKGLREICNYDYVNYVGNIPHVSIREMLVTHDIFISGEINPACPNSPLEAMACGLPVVGFDTGALSELVLGGSGLCADYGANPWKLEKPDMNNLLNSTIKVNENLEYHSTKALQNIKNNFMLSNMAKEYVKVFKTLI